MTALTSPRGPLPPRVYWTRRLLLLGVVFLLVFGIARVLGGGSDAKSEAPTAKQAAAEVQDVPPVASSEPDVMVDESPSAPGDKKRNGKRKKVEPTPVAPVLPTATSVCTNEDVVVTPTVAGAQGGGQVQFVLNFRTKVTPACTWQVSADTVTLKVTSGDDDIWASRECPRSVPTQDVTLYRDYDTSIPATWSGRRSDEDCSKLTEWVDAGWYHVLAATYAGEPVDVQFELGVPSPVTVTKTVQPAAGRGKNKGGASGEPSGAVEPNGG